MIQYIRQFLYRSMESIEDILTGVYRSYSCRWSGSDAQPGCPTQRLQSFIRRGRPIDEPRFALYASKLQLPVRFDREVHPNCDQGHAHRQQRYDVQCAVRDTEAIHEQRTALEDLYAR